MTGIAGNETESILWFFTHEISYNLFVVGLRIFLEYP